MARQIWFVGDPQRGCPKSVTVVIPGRVAEDGGSFSYRFVRDRATRVEDEDVEFILQQQVVDKHNYPMNVFKTEPPKVELNDADRMRMQMERQGEKIDELTGLLAGLLGENPELRAKLAPTEAAPDLLAGLVQN